MLLRISLAGGARHMNIPPTAPPSTVVVGYWCTATQIYTRARFVCVDGGSVGGTHQARLLAVCVCMNERVLHTVYCVWDASHYNSLACERSFAGGAHASEQAAAARTDDCIKINRFALNVPKTMINTRKAAAAAATGAGETF